MSAYISMATPMIDEECLLEALSYVGFPKSTLEIFSEPQKLVGYQGDARNECANIIIRRKHVGAGSNDIGFIKTQTGFRAIISEFDSTRYDKSWMRKLNDIYQKQTTEKQARLEEAERLKLEEQRRQLVEAQRAAINQKAKKMGYSVKETREGNSIRLVLVKRTY